MKKQTKLEYPASDLEKILIASGVINYMATVLEGVKNDYGRLVAANVESPVMKEGHKRHMEALKRAAKGITKVAEDLGNYLNNEDIADGQTLTATTAAFQILYDRIEA